MPRLCPGDWRCAAGAAPGAAGGSPLPGARIPPPHPGDARIPNPTRETCRSQAALQECPGRPGDAGAPVQSRMDAARHVFFLAEWQVTTQKKAHQSGKSHQMSKISRCTSSPRCACMSTTTPKAGRAQTPWRVQSSALCAVQPSTQEMPNISTCYSPGVLSHLPLAGEMKGSSSSQSTRLQGKERASHHPDSISELQAHETWLSKWLSLHASCFPLSAK